MQHCGIKSEIIVVNDGSNDGTGEICEEYAERYPSFMRVIHHRENFGYAAALRTGFQAARGNIIAIMDADLQSDPSDILKLLNSMNQGYDLVVGWRKERRDSPLRKLASKTYNALVNLLFGFELHDVNGKPKVMRRDVVKAVCVKGSGWVIDVELLSKAKAKGFRITETAVAHCPRKRGKSKVNLKSGIRTFIDVIRFKILES